MEYKSVMGAILSKENLLRAYKRVVSNGGAPGVDGIKVGELKAYLQAHWEGIQRELLDGAYRPAQVRGVEIPKANGGKRLLGIPTVMDRFIQQAVQQVLSRLWDIDFSDYSYGFRPGRNAQQALLQATQYINAGYQDVIDLDLKSFFDKVNHDKIMALLRKKIQDKALLRLIRRYLQSGIMLGGASQQREEGTPQSLPRC